MPYYCFHDRDVAPDGATFTETKRQPRRARRRRAGLPGADRRPAAVGHGQPVHPPALPGAAPRPTPTRRSSPTPRRRSRTCSRPPSGWAARTTCCGAAARATTRCSTPTCGARATSSARFLHLVAEHKHKIGFNGHAAHRAQADGADQAPVRLRHGDRPRLPGALRPGGRVPGQHRGQPRHAGRPLFHHEVAYAVANGSSAASTPTAATRRTAGTPTSSRTRSRTSPCRCTRSCAAAASRPAASTSTPSCAARASTGPTCSMPTSAAWTRSPGPARGRRPARAAASWPTASEPATPAGTGALGTASSAARERSRPRGAASPRARSTRSRVSGRQEHLENVVNQRIWAADR